MNRYFFRVIGCVLLAFVVIGCDRPAAGSLPVTRMRIGGETFNLEIATKFHDQETGLMHRDHLDADHGMIFPLPDEQVQTFWNHDVHFPLDVIFTNPGGNIVSIIRLEPFNDAGVTSGVPAKYAIELNAGTAARLKLKVGDHLELPEDAVGSVAK